jgi:hypothetical protein
MSNDTFCMGGSMSMDMLMNGFDWSWGEMQMCVIFLFQTYEVNSPGLLISSYVVTLVLAFAAHLVGYVRVRQRAQIRGKDYLKRLLQSFLYAVQVALGYLLMLIAMTCVGVQRVSGSSQGWWVMPRGGSCQAASVGGGDSRGDLNNCGADWAGLRMDPASGAGAWFGAGLTIN